MCVYKMRASEPASHESHAVHWRIIEKKNTIKIENSNMENITWTLTVVNKCLTLKQRLTPSPKMSAY